MSDYPQRIADSFSERKRLNQLRRKKEKLRFWTEFRVIPRWVIGTVLSLYLVAVLIAIGFNVEALRRGGEVFPPELQSEPALASLAAAGIVTAASLGLAAIIFWVAYVNRDAKRRGMNAALWTILVIILLPAWGFIGFVIYFLMREPLPYPCPECGTAVGARFNFCPNCKCNLHPSCPQCKQEVEETDKFCPNCGNDLKAGANAIEAPQSSI
jgi:hypothetical protein